MKQVTCLIASLAIILSLAFSASASQESTGIQYSLEFSGTSALCIATITEAGKVITATMELWCGNVPLAIWSDSGTSQVDFYESLTVASGMTYTLKVHGTINGNPFEATPLVKSN